MPTSAFSKGRPAAAAVLPAGACDCHLRVYDSRYPPVAGAALPPPAACIDDYRQVQRRKLRAVATPSAKRLKTLPRVPTMPEAGQKGFVIEQLQAVFLSALTPATDVQRLNADINLPCRIRPSCSLRTSWESGWSEERPNTLRRCTRRTAPPGRR